jgi:4-amino-4-deoxy-L-arabinose transferase-like glycosyltransferase
MRPTTSRAQQLALDLEEWCARHARLVVLVLVVLSVLVRAGYFAQIQASPLVAQHRWDQSDMNFFDAWARAIEGGDVWTDAELHPYHGWHRGIAAQHFRTHPSDSALAEAAPTGKEPGQLLWNRWYGGKTFHQEPLYAYLVAATYALFGPDVRWVFAWQLAAGVITNLLVFAIARRLFGGLVGALAGLLALLCAPLVYYEAILLRETLIVTASLALVYFGLRAFDERSPRAWLVFGAIGGLALLVKATFLPLLLVALLAVVWKARTDRAAAARVVGSFAAGCALCLAPALVRNVVVGAPALSLSAVGPVTFAAANTVDYPPEVGFFASTTHLPRIMGETEGAAASTAIAALRTHPDVESYLDLVRRKLAAMWRWYEIPNNTNFYFYRLNAPVLQWLPVGFAFAAPFGLLGMLLAWKHRGRAWLLYWSVAASASTMVLFYVLSRFRGPLLAAFLPFAAFAVVELVRWALDGRLVRAGAALAAAVALVVWTARPLPNDAPAIRSADWIVAYRVGYATELNEARQRDDWRAITAILERSLEVRPEEVERVLATNTLSGRNDVPLAKLYAQVYEQFAFALRKVGREADARAADERLRRLRALVPAAPAAPVRAR